MTLLRKFIRINETATSFICRRNIDYMIDVHIVGKVEGRDPFLFQMLVSSF